MQVSASSTDAEKNSTMVSQVSEAQVEDPSFPPMPSSIPSPRLTGDTGHRIFLDICAGASRPLSSAILALGGDVCSYDILVHSTDDLLCDSSYEQLLRLASSGLIGYGCGSPACRDYSRLKLRPNGPRAIRTPDQLSGIPGLTREERQRIYDGYTMLSRTVMVLTLVYLSGGHVHLEQPQNAMSWLESTVQSFIRQIAPYCVVVAACCYGASWDKAWLLATSFPPLQTLAGLCQHPRGTHESVIGARAADGSYLSRKTAEYPVLLADGVAKLVSPLLSFNSLDMTVSEAIQKIPVKSLSDFPFSSEDGGGLHSTPDWSLPGRTIPDSFHDLRHDLFDFVLSNNLHKEFLANIAKKSATPPFSEEIVDRARDKLSQFLHRHSKPVDWTVREHQPMYLSIMQALQSFMPNEDIPLFPSLIEGVSTGFHNDVPPSGCFPVNDKPELPQTPLSIHLANWQSADSSFTFVFGSGVGGRVLFQFLLDVLSF